MLKTLRSGDYHVTLISPETFTTFTPLLPCTYPAISRQFSSNGAYRNGIFYVNSGGGRDSPSPKLDRTAP